MARVPAPLWAAVLLLASSWIHRSSSLPACPEFCSCQRAPLLNCSSSGLSLTPKHIQDSVTELDLSHNLLDSLTLHRPHHNLRNVWLGNNSITRVSLCIERNLGSRYVRGREPHRFRLQAGCVSWAPALQLLSVERNQLVQLPLGLSGSASLQVLQLSFNRISTLQSRDLRNLRQLKELHLQHNLITHLNPEMIRDLAQIKVLDLSFNMLTSLHPLMYLSLRNIGADVSLHGNRWQCDCSMRSVRRWMAYDSSRGLPSWSVVCASPAILSGTDLLELEEGDLNCFSPEETPQLHQDVTVYSGSEVLLSCSMKDSVWWLPNGEAPLSQPQPGLLISGITERDTGIYVCVSEQHKVSVFNLHISKVGGKTRRTRSLPRSSQQIMLRGRTNRMGQERNPRATHSDLTLAVCLSVLITFLIAFILGVLARPLFDALCRRVCSKKRSSVTSSVSSVEQRSCDNEGYCSGEELEETRTHRERRVTFSTSITEVRDVEYYDTIVNEGHHSVSSDEVFESGSAEAENHTAKDPGSESSLQNNQTDGRDFSGLTDAGCKPKMESKHNQDPAELDDRRSISSSDSSLYEKMMIEDQMTKAHYMTPKSPQQAGDSVQQRAETVDVPKISIEGSCGFSSEPFEDLLPQKSNTSLPSTDLDLWGGNEEQFEFSDSVRSTSARSSSLFDSFQDSKWTVAPISDQRRMEDVSSSSSDVSDDEPSEYAVNPDPEAEDNTQRKVTHKEASFEQQIHGVGPIRPSVRFKKNDYGHGMPAMGSEDSSSSCSSNSDGEPTKQRTDKRKYRKKSRLDSEKLSSTSATGERDTGEMDKPMPRTKGEGLNLDFHASPPPAGYLSSSSSEREDEITDPKVEYNKGRVEQSEQMKFGEPQTLSADPAPQSIPEIHSRSYFNTQLPASDSSSSSDSASEKQDKQGKTSPQCQESQTQKFGPKWLAKDLDSQINRHLKVKASSHSADLSLSSESEGERSYIEKQKQGTDVAVKVSQTESQDPEAKWPALDLEHTTHNNSCLDIKAPAPPPDSSSSSDSEDETGPTEKQKEGKVDPTGLPFKEFQSVGHSADAKWPTLDLEHIPHIKRHLNVKVPSPVSASSSGSEDETTKKREQNMLSAKVPVKPQTLSHDQGTDWPKLDLGHISQTKTYLDIKAPAPAPYSSSSSDSESDTTSQAEKQRPRRVETSGPPLQESQKVSDAQQTQWPTPEHHARIKRPPASQSSSSTDSEDDTTNQTEKQKSDVGQFPKLSCTASQTAGPETQWPAVDLSGITQIKRRFDIKAPLPPADSLCIGGSADYSGKRKKEGAITSNLGYSSNSSGEQEVVKEDLSKPQITLHKDSRWPELDLSNVPRVERHLDFKASTCQPELSFSSDKGEDRDKSAEVARDRADVWIADHSGKKVPDLTAPFTKGALNIKTPSKPRDSSTSNSDNESRPLGLTVKRDAGITNHEQQTVSNELRVGVQPTNKHPDIRVPHPDQALSSISQSNSSTSDSEDDKNKFPAINIYQRPKENRSIKLEEYAVTTDDSGATSQISPKVQSQWSTMNLGFSRFRRHLEITSHTPESPSLPSASPPESPSSSSSESGTGSKSRGAKQKGKGVGMQELARTETFPTPENPPGNVPVSLKSQENMAGALNTRAPLINELSSSSDSEGETADHSTSGLSPGAPLDIKARSSQQSDSSSCPSEGENEATGHSGNLSGISDDSPIQYKRLIIKAASQMQLTGVGHHQSDISISRRHLDVNASSSPAAPGRPPPRSSNSSGGESDDTIKRDRRKAYVALMDKYSSLTPSGVSLSSGRPLDMFDNSSSSTNENRKVGSEERRERKGLSALKAMSSERRIWDTDNGNINMGAFPLHGDPNSQRGGSFSHHRPEEDIRPQPKPDLIPSYRRHAIEPPQGRPPPMTTWRSLLTSEKHRYENTSSHLQQRRSLEESDPSSLTLQNQSVFLDSSNNSEA